jgi:cell volume regulation protein A
VTVEQLDGVLFVGALVLLVAVAAVRLSVGTGLPSLLLYVALGLAIGPEGMGVPAVDPELARVLGYAALVIILADGGITTSWHELRPGAGPAAALATIGVGVSVVATAAVARPVLGLDWREALLLGAVLAPTDAAAVFSVLRRVPLPGRLTALLEAESGFNDAPAVILVVALSAHDVPDTGGDVALLFAVIVGELAGGLLVGLAVGRLAAYGLRRIALPSSGLYPIAAVAHVLVAYGAAALLHTSGFLAVYVTALVLGSSRLPHGPATRGFFEGLAWLAQIGLFVMLGLLVRPTELADALLPALAVSAALLLLARPASVVASLVGFRIPWREQVFASWAGLRGAVPIVLATIPVVAGVEGADRLVAVVFAVVVVSTLVQAPGLSLLARRLSLADPGQARDLAVEASPLGRLGADLLQVRVPPGSKLHGVELFELRLPPGAAITLVVRDGAGFVPESSTALRRGDELLVVVTADARELTERRLRAVSRAGRLAGWHDGRRAARPHGRGDGRPDDR